MKRALIVTTVATLGLFGLACADDTSSEGSASDSAGTSSETTDTDSDTEDTNMSGAEEDTDSNSGDGDGDSGDGDGDPATATDSGDGDGDATDSGDGDGDMTGDGDGDMTGDGDGDMTGDGDGDMTGDGDGDMTGDGDGDMTGDGDGDNPDCQAPPEHITCDDFDSDPTLFQALGLDCPGDASNSTPTTANSITSPDGQAWAIGRQFGTSGDWVATEGDTLVVITSGRIGGVDGNGIITTQNGSVQNGNPDGANLPAPMTPNDGSNNGNGGDPFQNCDGVGDCSGSLEAQWDLGGGDANDMLWFDFSVDVPAGTTGWLVDFVYFSNEFPEFVDSQFNDIFVIWEDSDSYVGNMCFIDGEPCTVTALDAAADAFSGVDTEGAPPLAGTGCQGSGSQGGQTTGLFSIEGPASPGENMELTFAVFDMADSSWDTMVVLDNWRWNCQGCIPNEVDNCGVQPQ